MKNFEKLTKHLYVADNQNGFNNSLYDYFGVESGNSFYTKKEIREMVENFPTQYPCAYIIIDLSMECNRLQIEIIPPCTFDELVHRGDYYLL